MLRALICSRYRPYHSHALDCVWQLREAILVLLLRCFLKEPYSAEALGQLSITSSANEAGGFLRVVTTTSSPRSSAATPRVASRRRCPRRKSWARMETAWRTVPAPAPPGAEKQRQALHQETQASVLIHRSDRHGHPWLELRPAHFGRNQRIPHEKVPVFRGTYTGWRNSVRHNLSLNDCFLNVLRDPSRPWGKDNYWMLNPQSEYTFADGVFRRRRKRISKTRARSQRGRAKLLRWTLSLRPPSSAKFTSSFAIDSILSRPFREEERKADTWHGGYVMRGSPYALPQTHALRTFCPPEDPAISYRHQRHFSPVPADTRVPVDPTRVAGFHPFRIDYLLS